MPKLKSKSGAKKRFKLTAHGAKRTQTNRRHLLTSKSRKNKRSLRAPAMVAKVDLPAVRKMLPYG